MTHVENTTYMTLLFHDINLCPSVQRTHLTFPLGLPEKTVVIPPFIYIGICLVNCTLFTCISILPYCNARTIPYYPISPSVLWKVKLDTLSHETSRDTGLDTFKSARENTPRSFQIVVIPYRMQDSHHKHTHTHAWDKQTKESCF